MILSPNSYRCRRHGVDLTEQVRDQLAYDVDADPDYLAFYRRSRADSAAEKFVVVVTCPGRDSPHTLSCKGAFYR